MELKVNISSAGRPSRKEELLSAALSVVEEHGPVGLSIEAVARRAGVSKAGVIYHFPQTRALAREVLGFLATALNDRVEHYLNSKRIKDEPRNGRWLRAYVRAMVKPASERERAALSVMAAYWLNDKEVLKPFLEMSTHWTNAAKDDGISHATAQLVRLVADSFWLEHSLGQARYPANLIYKELLERISTDAKLRSNGGAVSP